VGPLHSAKDRLITTWATVPREGRFQ
jgi:hypothetical protein